MSVSLMLNIKEDILKNAGNQTVDGLIDFHSIYFLTMDVNGDQQLFDYQHSSEYLLLCST